MKLRKEQVEENFECNIIIWMYQRVPRIRRFVFRVFILVL